MSQIIYKSIERDKCITIISIGYTLIIRGKITMNIMETITMELRRKPVLPSAERADSMALKNGYVKKNMFTMERRAWDEY